MACSLRQRQTLPSPSSPCHTDKRSADQTLDLLLSALFSSRPHPWPSVLQASPFGENLPSVLRDPVLLRPSISNPGLPSASPEARLAEAPNPEALELPLVISVLQPLTAVGGKFPWPSRPSRVQCSTYCNVLTPVATALQKAPPVVSTKCQGHVFFTALMQRPPKECCQV